jgi:hypothetical protein
MALPLCTPIIPCTSMALGLHLIPERKLELALVSLKAIAKR